MEFKEKNEKQDLFPPWGKIATQQRNDQVGEGDNTLAGASNNNTRVKNGVNVLGNSVIVLGNGVIVLGNPHKIRNPIQ